MTDGEHRAASAARRYSIFKSEILRAQAALGVRVDTLIDVACGDGRLTDHIARDLCPNLTVLVDSHPILEERPAGPSEFQRLDVCTRDFVETLRAKQPHLMTCLLAFHEFPDPLRAARNMVKTLPLNSALLILDRSEDGWLGLRERVGDYDEDVRRHYHEDMERVGYTGLDLDSGIRQFWEHGVGKTLTGTLTYTNHGTIYSVLYLT